MPNIREYNAPKLQLRPSDRAESALNRTASALGNQASAQARLGEAQEGAARAKGQGLVALGAAIGEGVADTGKQYVQWKTNKEVSQGLVAAAGIQNQLSQAWNQTASTADLNDTSIGPQFQEKTLEPILEKFVGGFSTEEGQRWAQNQAGQMREHFFGKTAADTATRAGLAAVQNFNSLGNLAATGAMEDPTSADANIARLKDGINALIATNPLMTPEMAGRLRAEVLPRQLGEVAKATIIGQAKTNPDLAQATLDSGKFGEYLDTTDVKVLNGFIESQRDSATQQAKANEAAARRAAKEAADADYTAITASVYDPESGTMRLPPDYYAKVTAYAARHGAEATNADTLYRYGAWVTDQMNNPGPQKPSDFYVYSDFANRVNLDDDDPRRLTMEEVRRAQMDGRLNRQASEEFADKVGTKRSKEEKAADKETNEFVKSFRSAITSANELTGVRDPAGDQYYMQFQINANRIAKSLKTAGKSDAEIREAIRSSVPAFVQGKERNRLAAQGVAENILPPEGQLIVGRGVLPGGRPGPTRSSPNPILYPAEATAYLRAHPDLAADFDKKYGAGAAAKALGK